MAEGRPLYVGADYAEGYRAGRITRRLQSKLDANEALTADDMADIQADGFSNFGNRARPHVLTAIEAMMAEQANPGSHPELGAWLAGLTPERLQMLTDAAGYLDTTPEELQRSGQFVARFITALGGGLDTPNPIAPQFRPSTTGPVQFTSSWPAAEEEVLDWTMSHYGLDARQAHVLGASMLTFLAGVDAAQRGIPR